MTEKHIGVMEAAIQKADVGRPSAKVLATAAAAALVEAGYVVRQKDCRLWSFYPIPMPYTVDGKGPATIGKDATGIAYEVWDGLYHSYSTHDNLPDAINDAIDRAMIEAAEKP